MNQEIGLAFQAWGLGLATLALLVLPGMTALDGILTEPFLEMLPMRVGVFLAMMLPGGLMTALFGVILSAPLFLIAFLTALAFRLQIARHPLAFAGLAPLVTVSLVAAVTVVTRDPGPSAFLPALQDALRVALRGKRLDGCAPVAAGSL